MANVCLPKELTEKFIGALRSGAIDPGKLVDMSSAERRQFFAGITGEDYAPHVNALFESKLLLKNQQAGMVNWAKKVAGITPEVRRDLITRISKMDRVLTAAEEKRFLEDLASARLGTHVSFTEAQQIAKLSDTLQKLKANVGKSEEARLKYGAAQVALKNFIDDLKLSNAKKTKQEVIQSLLRRPVGTIIEQISKIAGFAKGVKASLDNSALFRQGWKTLFTNPGIWSRNAVKSFQDIAAQLGKKGTNNDVFDAVKAEIYSRPNALDRTYEKMKLDIGVEEEAFPTTLPERIPVLGRLYKASQTAYTGFLYRMRADIADKYVEIAKSTGVDLADPVEIRSIGKLVNSLTGRGSLEFGKTNLEPVGKTINTIFFSPKLLKANIDFLTLHATDKMSVFARKQAAINLIKVAGGMAVILATAKALNPDSVELDSRSSDFAKIKIGNTRFDVSGGMGSLITLASRIVQGSSKSSMTGKITELNTGKYGAPTTMDLLWSSDPNRRGFFEGKLSPITSVVNDLIKQQTFEGTKPTLLGEAKNLFVPLPITNAEEAFRDPNSANDLLIIIADALGISTNTYAPKK